MEDKKIKVEDNEILLNDNEFILSYNNVILNVIVNHIEVKEFNNQYFNVYTLTEFTSGQNFSVWSREKVNYFDGAKLLLEKLKVKFNVVVTSSKIKLVPIELIKGV